MITTIIIFIYHLLLSLVHASERFQSLGRILNIPFDSAPVRSKAWNHVNVHQRRYQREPIPKVGKLPANLSIKLTKNNIWNTLTKLFLMPKNVAEGDGCVGFQSLLSWPSNRSWLRVPIVRELKQRARLSLPDISRYQCLRPLRPDDLPSFERWVYKGEKRGRHRFRHPESAPTIL